MPVYHALALAHLLATCKAPGVAVGSQAAVISVESFDGRRGGPNSNAIHDNTTGRSYYPDDRGEASAIANELIAAGHSVDVGLPQGNSGNFRGWRVTADDMLDPCTSVYVSGTFLEAKWLAAFSAVSYDRSRERTALEMMVSLYHGNAYRSPAYVARVVDAAQGSFVQQVVADYRKLIARRARRRQVASR